MEQLYGIAFTIKLCAKAGYSIEGYFPHVVPPLEGLWWQEGNAPIDLKDKKNFSWISMIRLPDFVQKKDFAWAVTQASRKKKKDFSKVYFFTLDEGECVQCMHTGPYDREPETIALIYSYAKEQNRIPRPYPKPATPRNISRRSPPLQTGKTKNRHQDSGKGMVNSFIKTLS